MFRKRESVTVDNPPTGTPALGIYVLTYNGLDILKQCLPSVLSQGHVILVDNGSSDDTREFVRAEWPGVTVVSRRQNVGLGAALNAAVLSVPAQNIVLMNNDVRVLDDALIKLSRLLDEDPTIGLATPKLLNSDGTLQEFGNDLGLSGLPAIPRRITLPLFETLFQAGCVTAARRDQFLAVGGYSQFFEWFYEDVDLAWKFRNIGLRTVVDDRAACIHFLGATLGHASREKTGDKSTPAQRRRTYYSTRNVLLMFAQDAPWHQALLQLPFILARQCVELISFFAARDREMANVYICAWRDAIALAAVALNGPALSKTVRWRRTSTLPFVQVEAAKTLRRLSQLAFATIRGRGA